MKKAQYDVAIIGAGHNGLVCAAYLAGKGLRVIVLEKNAVAGGAALTEEFHPGFRNSVAAYTVSLLSPQIMRELDLGAHGLSIVERLCEHNGWTFTLDVNRGAVDACLSWGPRRQNVDATAPPKLIEM